MLVFFVFVAVDVFERCTSLDFLRDDAVLVQLKSRWVETGPELLLALFMGPGLIKIAKWEHETVKYGNRD